MKRLTFVLLLGTVLTVFLVLATSCGSSHYCPSYACHTYNQSV